ncbi:hypothetical protein GFS31_13000 [Leptolyngbya sp. BL0902]|nr:hypothetical protein [Leptolyngbya sp. BL0902]QQE64619.1 hypothetical protein GFS31_13000 [Leptolyngbya sp. BL0902]
MGSTAIFRPCGTSPWPQFTILLNPIPYPSQVSVFLGFGVLLLTSVRQS